MVTYVILRLVSVVAPSASARKTETTGLDLSQHGEVADATASCSIIRSSIVTPASHVELLECLPVNRARPSLDPDRICSNDRGLGAPWEADHQQHGFRWTRLDLGATSL